MLLYVHLPFCRSKCRYCDFVSFPHHEHDMDRYVDALLREAGERIRFLHADQADTLFLGGGTPSILPAPLLKKLLSSLRDLIRFAPGAEMTSEANPGTLTDDWLDAAVSCGINRVSLGMQAAQDGLLRMLGRIHTWKDVVRSVDMLRRHGITDFNLDLMFGLPGQTPAMWEETLSSALSLGPAHISCYGLIPEEGTPLKQCLDEGTLRLPEEETEREMYDTAIRVLAKHGYVHYEISNFALPGHACRHNLGYWRQVPYLGLGASAASLLPLSEGDTAYVRTANPAGLEAYCAMAGSEDPSLRTCESISRRDAMFETLMLGLRTMEGVSEESFLQMHGISLDDWRSDTLRRLEGQGLLEHRDGFWRLTRRGMDIQNAILVDLMD